MPMTKAPHPKEHFNLYYIFLEDKQKNALSEEKADKLRRRIISRLAELQKSSDSG